VQTLFHNLLFLFCYSSLFAKLLYYLRSITFELLPLGYYPEAISNAKGYSNPSQVGVLIRATVYSSQSSGVLRNRLLGARLKGEES